MTVPGPGECCKIRKISVVIPQKMLYDRNVVKDCETLSAVYQLSACGRSSVPRRDGFRFCFRCTGLRQNKCSAKIALRRKAAVGAASCRQRIPAGGILSTASMYNIGGDVNGKSNRWCKLG